VGAGQVSEAGEWVSGGGGQQAETGWEAAWGFEADEEMDRAHDLHIISQEYPSFDMDRCASDAKKGYFFPPERARVRRCGSFSDSCLSAPSRHDGGSGRTT
jgi:hypothetical protein